VRVFLDTNLLVSAFATRGSAPTSSGSFWPNTLVTGEVVLRELTRVFRTRMRLPARTVDDIETFLREQVVVPRPSAPSPLRIRDADDRWVLASAIDARADLLVTGDRDLLEVATDAGVRIVDPRAFWELMCQP
jgi:putative PIN family toxin of toxin-antitoxin system